MVSSPYFNWALDKHPGTHLVVTDFHWDSQNTIFSPREITGTMEFLRNLVNKYNIHTLFILGDIFIMQEHDKQYMLEQLLAFDTLPVQEILILPGNHDRNLGDFTYREDFTRTQILSHVAICVRVGNIAKLLLTHDARGRYYSDTGNPGAFIEEIRTLLRVPRPIWVVTGHTHQKFVDTSKRNMSLGVFSISAQKISPNREHGPHFAILQAIKEKGVQGRIEVYEDERRFFHENF